MAIDLKITSTYAGKTVSSTVSDISPNATNAQLAQLGRKLIDFSDGTYEKGSRVETINVDTTPGGGVKPEPTLTLSRTTIAASELGQIDLGMSVQVTVTTNSDGQLFIAPNTAVPSGKSLADVPICQPIATADGYIVHFSKHNASNIFAQTFYIGVTETDTYAAKEVAVNFTA